jgi:UDP-N-acetylglucosamine 2-epimerase (non-hydrolysing)
LNRVLTDNLSDLLFVTEESAVKNLKNENIDDKKIYFVGNVMIDTLLHFKEAAENSEILKKLNLEKNNFCLATFHRQENVNNKELLREILKALNEISKFVSVVIPLHPRTKKAISDFGFNGLVEKLNVLPAQSYFDFLNLEMNAKFIITDSGGIQEEASIFGVPCITCRTETERPVTCELGTNEMAGVSKEKIIALAMKANSGDWKKGQDIPLWDGHAAERIMKIISEYLGVM